jgi:hypothetical protein
MDDDDPFDVAQGHGEGTRIHEFSRLAARSGGDAPAQEVRPAHEEKHASAQVEGESQSPAADGDRKQKEESREMNLLYCIICGHRIIQNPPLAKGEIGGFEQSEAVELSVAIERLEPEMRDERGPFDEFCDNCTDELREGIPGVFVRDLDRGRT